MNEDELYMKFLTSEKRKEIKALLTARLEKTGWKGELKKYIKSLLLQDDTSLNGVEDLVDQVTPKAKEMIPANIKKEIYDHLNKYIQEWRSNSRNDSYF